MEIQLDELLAQHRALVLAPHAVIEGAGRQELIDQLAVARFTANIPPEVSDAFLRDFLAFRLRAETVDLMNRALWETCQQLIAERNKNSRRSRPADTEKNARILEELKGGDSRRTVAQRHGVNMEAVKGIVRRAREADRAEPPTTIRIGSKVSDGE